MVSPFHLRCCARWRSTKHPYRSVTDAWCWASRLGAFAPGAGNLGDSCCLEIFVERARTKPLAGAKPGSPEPSNWRALRVATFLRCRGTDYARFPCGRGRSWPCLTPPNSHSAFHQSVVRSLQHWPLRADRRSDAGGTNRGAVWNARTAWRLLRGARPTFLARHCRGWIRHTIRET